MSRGYGRRQRAVLNRLSEAIDHQGCPEWVPVTDDVRSAAEREGVRRAVRALEQDGAVEVRRGRQLHARLPLDAKQRAREQQRQRQQEHSDVRGRLDRARWPEALWTWYESDYLPGPDSELGSRLIRAGLPPEMLTPGWWEDRYRSNQGDPGYHAPRSWYDLSDVPAHLRFEPREPATPRSVLREDRRLEREAAAKRPPKPLGKNEMETRIAALVARERAKNPR